MKSDRSWPFGFHHENFVQKMSNFLAWFFWRILFSERCCKSDSPENPKDISKKGLTGNGQPYLSVTTSLTSFMKVLIKDVILKQQS